MINSIGISMTGLQASGLRMANSANNVANVHSTSKQVDGKTVNEPYTPTDVVQKSLEPTGGTRAEVRERDPATSTRPVYDPSSAEANEEGLVEYPNVSLEEEVIEQQTATYDYKANLKALKTADEMLENLLDIKT